MFTKVGIIGGGNMGEAILKGIRRKFSVSVCEQSARRRNYLKRTFKVKIKNLQELAGSSKVVILAVKPQNFDAVLDSLSKVVTKQHLVVSIAAGITTSYIEKKLGRGIKVIRTMPNMPAQIGEGITAVAKGKYAKAADVNLVCKIFNNVGESVVVKEDLIDAITAVSGSGPAYVFLFAESMIKAAQSLGLSKKMSEQFVLETLKGSSSLLLQSKDDAATLRQKVTSKKGTTEAALKVFFKHQYSTRFGSALKAAKKRAKELSRR